MMALTMPALFILHPTRLARFTGSVLWSAWLTAELPPELDGSGALQVTGPYVKADHAVR